MASETETAQPQLSPGGSPAESPNLRLAAIDIGSNSIHMIIAQVDTAGGITTLWRFKEMVGLGRISFPERKLSGEAMGRALVTLGRFQATALQRQCAKVIAVATSAVRESENGGDFIEKVRAELRLNIKVVSGKEEARLIYLGVRHAVDLSGGPHLILDVGGGSVEFIVADDREPALLESRKLGAARMSAQFVKSDPISAAELKALLAHYDHELAPLCRNIAALRPVHVYGTSGTLENLSVMSGGGRSAKAAKNNSHDGVGGIIEREGMDDLADALIESASADRVEMDGLDEKRQDQIVAGALLVRELFHRLNLRKVTVCRSALREGMLVDHLTRHAPELAIRRTVPDPRRRSVLDLGRRCGWNPVHSQHVAAMVLQLFDALEPLHRLGRRQRELVEYGALLHDIGWHISPSAHHKHAMYLIMHGALKDFTEEETSIIANVARYHRKSLPKPEHEAYAALPNTAQKVVRVGAALLRVADGLDRSHVQVISIQSIKIARDEVRIALQARGDSELEMWAVRRKMDFFEDVFGLPIRFEVKQKG